MPNCEYDCPFFVSHLLNGTCPMAGSSLPREKAITECAHIISQILTSRMYLSGREYEEVARREIESDVEHDLKRPANKPANNQSRYLILGI